MRCSVSFVCIYTARLLIALVIGHRPQKRQLEKLGRGRTTDHVCGFFFYMCIYIFFSLNDNSGRRTLNVFLVCLCSSFFLSFIRRVFQILRNVRATHL